MAKRKPRTKEPDMMDEFEAYDTWLQGLKEDEREAFFKECWPDLVTHSVVPPSALSPFEMPVEEAIKYVLEALAWILEPKSRPFGETLAVHQVFMNQWQLWLKRSLVTTS